MDEFKKELKKLKASEFKAENVTPWDKEKEQETMLVRSRCGRCSHGRCGGCARCGRCGGCGGCSCSCSCFGTCFFPCFFPCTQCARCF
ncbi:MULTISPECIES: heterocycloanthracin/sonorensin family bacteriocin [Brevibacillus]|uniref:Heterocycloanthracin/sonorensin family bacteriocin n=1 Tax=Brevibacillus agri TaxID=51101 RepID=A0A3M8AA79_9BACL|nr:heterocycloanthracin/sonorensin family bacteriocin [Brevibacillus agri]QAV14074.1 heterocycloanthracin/sonorensin family bacteriocin [Brevibacillus agri]QHZ56703.1 heterocycloanthracin/sonorensin family bacteriocin [Brevibacillus sp. NSP2.1]RNB48058.1 heterocycloanthracin/sonorensin family bacteriocin [Brevibacillus agri]